jgi:hypothetical protein
MPLIIKTNDNNYTFNDFNEIPLDLYKKIIVLKCNDNNLYNIDFIENFINLKKLYAGNNKIKYIPLISSLEELEIYNNQLTELPILQNLTILYAFNNKLRVLPYLPKLKIIDVSHNIISKILLGENIEKIHVSYNKLINIIINGKNVVDIECNSNLLKDINFIHGLTKLNKFDYNDNPIIIVPVHIKRFINNKISNNNIETNSKHTLDEMTIKKILIIANNYNYKKSDADNIRSEIIKLLPTNTLKLLKKYTSETYLEPSLRLSFLELFCCYWDIITKRKLVDKLNKLNDIECDCTTCLFKFIIDIM